MATKVTIAFLAGLLLLPFAVKAVDAGDGDVWREALPGTAISEITPEPRFPGVYEIVAGDKVIYGDATGRYLLFGHIYDVQANEDVTQRRIDEVNAAARIPWAALPLERAVRESLAPAGAPKLAVLFSPECGWCRLLYGDVKSRKSDDGTFIKGVEFRADVRFMILSPQKPEWRGGPKPAAYYAYALADRVVCSTVPAMALKVAMQDDGFRERLGADPENALFSPLGGLPPRERFPDAAVPTPLFPEGRVKPEETCDGEKALADVREFANAHKLNTTPVLISGDGRVHRGYLPPDRLIEWLNEGKKTQ